MEPMFQCNDCGGWVRSFSGNDCTCDPQKQYSDGKAGVPAPAPVATSAAARRPMRRNMLAVCIALGLYGADGVAV